MSERATTGEHPSLEDVAALADGRLDGAARDRVAAHLGECAKCYRFFADVAAVARPDALEPPAARRQIAGEPPAAGARVLRPGPGRWRRTALAGAALAAAAALALLVWRPSSDLLAPGSQATVESLTAGLDPAAAAPVLAATWQGHEWPEVRGSASAPGADEARAFRVGVRVAELDVALAAGDRALAVALAADLRRRLAAVELAEPLVAFYGDDGVTGRLAAGAATADVLALHRRADALLADGEGSAGGFVDPSAYALGKWAGAARLAAASGDAVFFMRRGSRRLLHEIGDSEPPAEVAARLEVLQQAIDDGAGGRLPEIARTLDELITVAGGGQPPEQAAPPA
jgi:hypothetical protein